MSQPGYLSVGGVEIANNARTTAYLASGIATPQFEIVYGEVCPNLDELAFPLEVCDGLATASADQFYADPRPGWRAPLTGLAPTASGVVWDRSGWVAPVGQTPTSGGGMIFPDPGTVALRIRQSLEFLKLPAADFSSGEISRVVNPGTANVGWIGMCINRAGGVYRLRMLGRTPAGNPVSGPLGPALTFTGPDSLWLEVVFTSTGQTATVYGSDPAVAGALVYATASYGYDTATAGSQWFADTGQTEAATFATVTQAGILSFSTTFPPATEMVTTEIDVLPGAPCVATGTSYPSLDAWPGGDQYPGRYGTFTNPGADGAPWIDPDWPASNGYLGLLVSEIEGLDTTETRSMSGNASGIGGILGPQTLEPRELKVKGWLLATGPDGMQYARRWLAEVLAGALCPGCEGSYVDVLTTCGGSGDDNLWRMYDAGLTAFEVDLSDSRSCDYVVPVSFTIGVGDPFLYKLPELVSGPTSLNPDGADSPPVPFETWLFGAETPICVDIADPDVGITAPVFVFSGGSTGIESGIVYRAVGNFPSSSMYPGECVYPADGPIQWDITVCPFAFTFSIGAGETFVIDNSRQFVDWYLADGQVLNGAPQLNLQAGQVVQWIDTCNDEAVRACAIAFSGCTCDPTASVTIYTQHRER